jgi:transposase
MKAYSMDLRERALADSDAGLRSGLVAKKYGVSSAWVRRLKQRRRETGRISPFSQRHGPLPRLKGHEDELMALVRRQPDATVKELSRRLSIKVSRPTVQKMLQRLRMTYKKRH